MTRPGPSASTGWLMAAAGLAVVVILLAAAWFAVPRWFPRWTMAHAPWPGPVITAMRTVTDNADPTDDVTPKERSQVCQRLGLALLPELERAGHDEGAFPVLAVAMVASVDIDVHQKATSETQAALLRLTTSGGSKARRLATLSVDWTRLDMPTCRSELGRLVVDAEPSVHQAALKVLMENFDGAPWAVPLLVDRFDDVDADVRGLAVVAFQGALATVAASATDYCDDVARLVDDPDDEISSMAYRTFLFLPRTPRWEAAAGGLLRATHESARLRTIRGLSTHRDADPSWTSAMCAALLIDPSAKVREAVLTWYIRARPDTAEWRAALEQVAASDTDAECRAIAGRILKRIDADAAATPAPGLTSPTPAPPP